MEGRMLALSTSVSRFLRPIAFRKADRNSRSDPVRENDHLIAGLGGIRLHWPETSREQTLRTLPNQEEVDPTPLRPLERRQIGLIEVEGTQAASRGRVAPAGQSVEPFPGRWASGRWAIPWLPAGWRPAAGRRPRSPEAADCRTAGKSPPRRRIHAARKRPRAAPARRSSKS